MIHHIPAITSAMAADLAEIKAVREDLRFRLDRPAPWVGQIRRAISAELVRNSTGIEGFVVSGDQALDLIEGRERRDVDEATQNAVRDYAAAMERVAVLSLDPDFDWTPALIRELHYVANRSDIDAHPGRWRPGFVGIRGGDGSLVYSAPDAGDVRALIAQACAWLRDDTSDPIVRAAMAHLHIAAIHPFKDGNGRTARIVHSLVLGREGVLSPEFASIEVYLGHHTDAYYAALHAANGATYDPTRDATPFLELAITAHLVEARARVHIVELAAQRFEFAERVVAQIGLPDRTATAVDMALGAMPVHRETYEREHGISTPQAVKDLRALVDANLLRRVGRTRGAHYVVSAELEARYAREGGAGR